MKLLVTGGAGFIGSNLILYWLKNYPDDKILNLDKLTYAGNLDNLDSVKDNTNYRFVKADIAKRADVKDVINKFCPDGVIHLAAESHVDNSIKDPEAFVLTNLLGTFNLLEECRQLWNRDPVTFKGKRFHHVSTDEVYGSLSHSGSFTESTRYAPNSPYSATKAGSDHLVRAYYQTYQMNISISNCSNNFGPHQHEEKLIPTVIRNALAKQPIPVYGTGKNIRDWLFVEDHCHAIDLVFHKGRSGETYNIGSHNEWGNIDIVRKICDILNKIVGEGPKGDYKNLITFIADRPGHDFRYAINSGKIEKELGWKPLVDFETSLQTTVRWYVEKFQ